MSAPSLLRTLRIMFAAMIVSLGFYVGIGFVMSEQLASTAPATTGTALPDVLLIALCVVSAGMLMAIPLVRRMLKNAAPSRAPRPGAGTLASQRYFSMSIVSWAMCEAVGVFGLLLTLVAREPKYVVVFAAVALLNLLIYRPTAAGAGTYAEEPGE